MECFWIYIVFLPIKLWIWVMEFHKFSSQWVSVILQYSLIVTIFRTWDRFPFFLTQGKFSQSHTEGESNLLSRKDSFAPRITSISIHICIFNQNNGFSIKQKFQKGWRLSLWFCFSLKFWFLYYELPYFLWYNAVCLVLLLHFIESFLLAANCFCKYLTKDFDIKMYFEGKNLKVEVEFQSFPHNVQKLEQL